MKSLSGEKRPKRFLFEDKPTLEPGSALKSRVGIFGCYENDSPFFILNGSFSLSYISRQNHCEEMVQNLNFPLLFSALLEINQP